MSRKKFDILSELCYNEDVSTAFMLPTVRGRLAYLTMAGLTIWRYALAHTEGFCD